MEYVWVVLIFFTPVALGEAKPGTVQKVNERNCSNSKTKIQWNISVPARENMQVGGANYTGWCSANIQADYVQWRIVHRPPSSRDTILNQCNNIEAETKCYLNGISLLEHGELNCKVVRSGKGVVGSVNCHSNRILEIKEHMLEWSIGTSALRTAVEAGKIFQAWCSIKNPLPGWDFQWRLDDKILHSTESRTELVAMSTLHHVFEEKDYAKCLYCIYGKGMDAPKVKCKQKYYSEDPSSEQCFSLFTILNVTKREPNHVSETDVDKKSPMGNGQHGNISEKSTIITTTTTKTAATPTTAAPTTAAPTTAAPTTVAPTTAAPTTAAPTTSTTNTAAPTTTTTTTAAPTTAAPTTVTPTNITPNSSMIATSTVKPPENTSSNPEARKNGVEIKKTAVYVGAAIGALVLCAAVAIVVRCWLKRRPTENGISHLPAHHTEEAVYSVVLSKKERMSNTTAEMQGDNEYDMPLSDIYANSDELATFNGGMLKCSQPNPHGVPAVIENTSYENIYGSTGPSEYAEYDVPQPDLYGNILPEVADVNLYGNINK